VDVRFVSGSTVEVHGADGLAELLARDDGITWVDIPEVDDEAAAVLADTFGFHPIAIRACAERNRVAKVHAYPDHFFFALHGPELGAGGHVHYVEIDQFVGTNFLVTVHGPVNPAVHPDVALRETNAVLARIESGRFKVSTPAELSYAIVSALTRHMSAFVERLTEAVWALEQRVTAGDLDDPERVLEEMFRTRHGLLAVGSMAASGREIYKRMSVLARVVPADTRPLVEDVVDQFDRVAALATVQRDYLQGVIDFYRARTDTKMTIAAERLAVVAVVTLPVTALASVYGMNIIVNESTDVPHLAGVLVVMLLMSGGLLLWARRQGWF
jgi:Mg2+ and Co2+ transporter CorA